MKKLGVSISLVMVALLAPLLHAATQTVPKLVVELKGHAKNIKGLAFSSNGKQLCSVAEDNEVKIWDVAARSCIATIHLDDLRSHHVPFSPDGKTIATARKDSSIKLLEASTGKLVLNLVGHTEPVVAVAFSADGKMLASASSVYGRNNSKDYEGEVRLWDIGKAKHVANIKGDQAPLDVAFSRDSKTLASTWRGGTIR
ncbi:MAG TPA: hypothetical protein VE988_16300, partial [Gemmataceae bacterium]|nr:hypothetical protein [Gemmataceae bacterium]